MSLSKTYLTVLGMLSMLFMSSCQSNSSQQSQAQKFTQNLEESDSSIRAEAFSPSHAKGIELIPRDDGDFDTPVDITFRAPDGKIWIAPAGTITDGASIPNVFAGFFGGKKSEKHLFAAIVHDAYCARANEQGPKYQTERWQDTHHMFYHACISNGRSITKASTMYAAVRLGGPRWPFEGESFTSLEDVDPAVLQEEMEYCRNWINSKGESLKLEEIDQWMSDREQILLGKESE